MTTDHPALACRTEAVMAAWCPACRLGQPCHADPQFVGAPSALALYPREVLADDAGVPPDGSGFRGVTFSYVVRSEERVDAVLAEADRAGGTIHKPAQAARWGGYFGYSPIQTAISGRSWQAPGTCRSPSRTAHHRPTLTDGGRQ